MALKRPELQSDIIRLKDGTFVTSIRFLKSPELDSELPTSYSYRTVFFKDDGSKPKSVPTDGAVLNSLTPLPDSGVVFGDSLGNLYSANSDATLRYPSFPLGGEVFGPGVVLDKGHAAFLVGGISILYVDIANGTVKKQPHYELPNFVSKGIASYKSESGHQFILASSDSGNALVLDRLGGVVASMDVESRTSGPVAVTSTGHMVVPDEQPGFHILKFSLSTQGPQVAMNQLVSVSCGEGGQDSIVSDFPEHAQ